METVITNKMWKNITLMLSDRGYHCIDENVSKPMDEDHESIWVNDKKERLVLAILVSHSKLKKGIFSELLKRYKSSKYKSMVIVTREKQMNATSDIAKNCNIFIQCINYTFFNCNIARHIYQSKTRLRDYTELTSFGPKEGFPKVLSTDSLVIYYGYKSGDVIEYLNTSNNELYWRVVQ